MEAAERRALIEDELAIFREDLSVSGEAPEEVSLATAHIHHTLFDPDLTVKRLREQLGLTSSTFSTRFRRRHGRTPARYIRWLRVEAAKRLLRHEELRIADIAFHVGYEHYRTFARVFTRVTGRSPQAFRDEIEAD